jgi:dTDP-4-amino-4,6-dideoxygalactose transaminase
LPTTWLSVFPAAPPWAHLARPRNRLPFPLDQPGCRLYSRARSGLAEGLRALGLGPGDGVLAPALHHGSEIATLVSAGVRCRFYDVGAGLEPDADELASLVAEDTRALYLIHYWGMTQDEPRWRAWCDARGLLLLVDGAHAFLATRGGRPAGALADLAIYCAYKTFGLPDGGLLACRIPLPPPAGPPRSGLARLDRVHRNWIASRVPRLARLRAQARHSHEYVETAERDFAPLAPEPPARATTWLLPRIADVAAAALRREHHRALDERLADLRAGLFPALGSGDSPAGYPIDTAYKGAWLEHLAARGIIDGKMWVTPHPAMDPRHFPNAAAVRARVIALPVHQELRTRDVDRIVDAARTAP